MAFRLTTAILIGAATVVAQTATIVIEASHGGAGSGLTNTTITVPLNTRYTDEALSAVSTLYLTEADGVPLDSVTCTPYRYSNLTGAGGLPFTSTSPSLLSTNTVPVGSLLCNSTEGTSTSSTASVTSTLSFTTATVPSNLSTTASIGGTTAQNGNVILTTITPSLTSRERQTVISTAILTGGDGRPTATSTFIVDGATSTISGTPSLNSESAATARRIGGWTMQGLAVLGIGLMAAI